MSLSCIRNKVLRSALRRSSYDLNFRRSLLADSSAALKQEYDLDCSNDVPKYSEVATKNPDVVVLPPIMDVKLNPGDLKLIYDKEQIVVSKYE